MDRRLYGAWLIEAVGIAVLVLLGADQRKITWVKMHYDSDLLRLLSNYYGL